MTSVKPGVLSVVFLTALLVSAFSHQSEQTLFGDNSRALTSGLKISQGVLPDHGSHLNQPSAESLRVHRKTTANAEGSRGQNDNRPEVKVVTFNQGRFDPSILEPIRFWPRGHTAVIINGDVYSFEANWQCGDAEAEYKDANAWRGAWVQVLDISASDARQIQQDFRQSCGTGAFLLTGVCTSSAGRLLQNVLADLEVTWAPTRLRRQLAESGHVERTDRWHRTVWTRNVIRCVRERDRSPPWSAGPVDDGLRTARDKCLKQLGLSKKDIALPLESLADAITPDPLDAIS